MSMLSSQVDELRELATRYDELQVGAVKAVTMPPNMGSILREAADTIWQLRDDLQRANADNAKLREQVDAAHMSRLLTENENEKLRELVAKYSAAAKYLCGFSHCNECNLDCASVFGDVPSGWDCARMLLDKKARELGVEVE